MSEKEKLMNEMFSLSNKIKTIALKINNLEDKPKKKNIKIERIAGTTLPQINSGNFNWQNSLRSPF